MFLVICYRGHFVRVCMVQERKQCEIKPQNEFMSNYKGVCFAFYLITLGLRVRFLSKAENDSNLFPKKKKKRVDAIKNK